MEPGTQEYFDFMASKVAERDRESVAQLEVEGLVTQWDVVVAAKRTEKEAQEAHKQERDRYKAMLAEALGVTVGMRVTRTKERSWRDKTLVTQTFEVTGWKLTVSPAMLSLHGRTIRKDGTLGETHEIGSRWERVKEVAKA